MQQGLVRVVTGDDAPRPSERTTGFGSDLEEFLSSEGWRIAFRSHTDVADFHGRDIGIGKSGAGYLTASRITA